MKYRVANILLIVLVISLFFGCTSDNKEEHPFSVTLPTEWGNRAEAVLQENGVDIYIDGQLSQQFRIAENMPGAHEVAKQLQEEGYYCYGENGDYFFFHNTVNKMPDNLEPQVRFTELIRPNPNAGFCHSVNKNDHEVYVTMHTNQYVNHRLGIAFTLPDSMVERCMLMYQSFHDNFIYVVFQEEDDGEMHEYILCQFVLIPPEDPHIEIYDNPEGYPELFYVGDVLCGGLNWWKEDIISRSGESSEPYWSSLPEDIQNTFSTETVQELIDSLEILVVGAD